MSNCITTPFNECSSYPNSRCVIYTGPNLNNIDVFTNDRLENILKKINAAFSNIGTSITLTGDVIGSGTNTIDTTVVWDNGLSTYNTYYTPLTRQLTINGTTYDLSQNRTWTIPTYTLTPATTSVLGGVIIGSGITVQPDGTISVSTNYQTPITLTTINNSGSATFISNVLNIPTYTLSGLGGQPLSANLTSLSELTYSSLGFVKMSASGTFSLDTNTYITSVGTGVTNEITYWSGTNTLGSLSTSTYPSLTELSYVKGVTSSIQTQLNAKGSGTVTSIAALTLGTSGTDLSSTVANSTTTPVITLNVPDASVTARGVISTGSQTISGAKTFNSTLTSASTFIANSTITATSNGHRFGNLQIDTTGTAGTTGRGIVCGTTGASTESMIFYSGITAIVPDCYSFNVYSGTGRSLTGNTTRNFFSIYGGSTNAVANTAICNILNIRPTYNNSGSISSNTIRGIYYNPTLTSLTGTTHIGLEIVSGNNYINSTSGNTGIGLSSGSTILDKLTIDGNINLITAGNKIKITTGTNASIGTSTLVNGTVTVLTTAVTSNSIIFATYNTPSGTLASGLSTPSGSISSGTSFVINSLTTSGIVNTLDNSTVNWWIIN